MTPIEQYIRARAPLYGVDPDIAVKVALSEGGLSDPVRQSDVTRGGVREESYGPFQLNMRGGVGASALAAGIDPRDPNQWQQATDYALAEAGRKGWGQWYGAANTGIGDFEGISGYTGVGPTGAGTKLSGPPSGGTDIFTPGMQTGLPPSGSTAGTEEPGFLDKLLSGSGAADVAKGAGGGGAGEQTFHQIKNSGLRPHTGSEGAAQLLASVLESRRKRHGISLTGMES